MLHDPCAFNYWVERNWSWPLMHKCCWMCTMYTQPRVQANFHPCFGEGNNHLVVTIPTVWLINFTLSNADLPVFRDAKDKIKESNLSRPFSGTEQTVLTELTENIAMVKHAKRQLLELTNDVWLNKLRDQIENILDLIHRIKGDNILLYTDRWLFVYSIFHRQNNDEVVNPTYLISARNVCLNSPCL